MEVGAGSGQLGYLILKQLSLAAGKWLPKRTPVKSGDESAEEKPQTLKICYVMTVRSSL